MNQMCNARMYLKCNTYEEIEYVIMSTLKISRGKVITNNIAFSNSYHILLEFTHIWFRQILLKIERLDIFRSKSII